MIKLLIFSLILIISANAQTTSADSISSSKDSINISQLVQDQISKIQENQKTSTNKPVVSDWGTSNKEELSSSTKDVLSPGLKYKFAAIILAMIISAIYLVLKRKKVTKKKNRKSLKENISSLRAERPIRREKNELSIIRTNLKKNAVFLSSLEREISNSAKDLKIAKGELYLAAELKSLELTKIGDKRTMMAQMI